MRHDAKWSSICTGARGQKGVLICERHFFPAGLLSHPQAFFKASARWLLEGLPSSVFSLHLDFGGTEEEWCKLLQPLRMGSELRGV